MDEAGRSRWFPLSGHQHVDYAWVSTTYGSQGKTADRVLALMSEQTTNRESFYVAVSRAKHGLKIYTADKDELLKRSQTSRAKENASDYIPLFRVGENYAETQKEIKRESRSVTNNNGRDIGKRVGDCLAREFASQSSAYTDRYQGAFPAHEFDRAGTSADDSAFESIAESFERILEPLSHAISEHIEQSEFIEGKGLFAKAVAAVDRSFEQLERSVKNRNQLAAAVDRFDAAVGGKADTAQPELDEDNGKDALDYNALWRCYRQGVEADTKGELDYLIGRRAFEDGVERRAIALMLAAESTAVQQIYESNGKQRAMKYVNYMIRRICQEQPMKEFSQSISTKQQMELD
ncbi:MAG: hypothetical protein AAFP20_22795 [Cyanobacteria bacterium J06614_10]